MRALLLAVALGTACSTASSPSSLPPPDPTPTTVPAFTTSLDAFFDDVTDSGVLLQATGSGTRTERPLLQTGPQHCDGQDSLWMVTRGDGPGPAQPVGYLRDPKDTVPNFAHGTYDPHAALPSTARATGWVVGSAELWLGPDEATAAYVVNAADRRDVERWPALAGACA